MNKMTQSKALYQTAMKIFISTVTAVFALFFFTLSAYGQSTPEASVIGVKMDAEWCGKCQVMNPKMDNIRPQFEDESILFTWFDMTDEFTTQQAGFLASKLGLYDLYAEHKGQTGYMVLLNAETHEVLGRLTSDQSEEELVADIQSALNSVR